MSSLINRIRDVFQREGVLSGIHRLCFDGISYYYFWYIRPHVPRRREPVDYNDVTVRASRWFDGVAPGTSRNAPDYEAGIVTALEDCIDGGDRIVIVGGGWGVTAVTAAQLAGSNGSVVVFEGGSDQVHYVEETAELNDIGDRIRVEHAIIGPAEHLKSTGEGAIVLDPTDHSLPPCDVLKLDCEGAEVEILDALSIRPSRIIVETHGLYGAPSDTVRQLLFELGYTVEDRGLACGSDASEDEKRWFDERDVRVLLAERER